MQSACAFVSTAYDPGSSAGCVMNSKPHVGSLPPLQPGRMIVGGAARPPWEGGRGACQQYYFEDDLSGISIVWQQLAVLQKASLQCYWLTYKARQVRMKELTML